MESRGRNMLYLFVLIFLGTKDVLSLDCYDCLYLTDSVSGFGPVRSMVESQLQQLKMGGRSCLTGPSIAASTCSTGRTCSMSTATFNISSPGYGYIIMTEAMRGCEPEPSVAECVLSVHSDFDSVIEQKREQFKAIPNVHIHVDHPNVLCCGTNLCNDDDLTDASNHMTFDLALKTRTHPSTTESCGTRAIGGHLTLAGLTLVVVLWMGP